MLEERGGLQLGLKTAPESTEACFLIGRSKKGQTDNRCDCRSVAVLRAGVEPAQVSLSVFETDASTDSAIGALGCALSCGLWVQRYTYF